MRVSTVTGVALAGILALSAWQGTLQTAMAGMVDALPGPTSLGERTAATTEEIDPDLAEIAAFMGVPESAASQPLIEAALGAAQVQRDNAQQACDDLALLFPGALDEPCEATVLSPGDLVEEVVVLHGALGIDAAPMTVEERSDARAAGWAEVNRILGVDPDDREEMTPEEEADLWAQLQDIIG